MAKEFTQISIPKELHEKLKVYTDKNCMKMSPFVEKLINGAIHERNDQDGESDVRKLAGRISQYANLEYDKVKHLVIMEGDFSVDDENEVGKIEITITKKK